MECVFFVEWQPVSGYEYRGWIDGQRCTDEGGWEWSTGEKITHHLASDIGSEMHVVLSGNDYEIHDLHESEGIGALCEACKYNVYDNSATTHILQNILVLINKVDIYILST